MRKRYGKVMAATLALLLVLGTYGAIAGPEKKASPQLPTTVGDSGEQELDTNFSKQGPSESPLGLSAPEETDTDVPLGQSGLLPLSFSRGGYTEVGTWDELKFALALNRNSRIRLTGDIIVTNSLDLTQTGTELLHTIDGNGHTIWNYGEIRQGGYSGLIIGNETPLIGTSRNIHVHNATIVSPSGYGFISSTRENPAASEKSLSVLYDNVTFVGNTPFYADGHTRVSFVDSTLHLSRLTASSFASLVSQGIIQEPDLSNATEEFKGQYATFKEFSGTELGHAAVSTEVSLAGNTRVEYHIPLSESAKTFLPAFGLVEAGNNEIRTSELRIGFPDWHQPLDGKNRETNVEVNLKYAPFYLTQNTKASLVVDPGSRLAVTVAGPWGEGVFETVRVESGQGSTEYVRPGGGGMLVLKQEQAGAKPFSTKFLYVEKDTTFVFDQPETANNTVGLQIAHGAMGDGGINVINPRLFSVYGPIGVKAERFNFSGKTVNFWGHHQSRKDFYFDGQKDARLAMPFYRKDGFNYPKPEDGLSMVFGENFAGYEFSEDRGDASLLVDRKWVVDFLDSLKVQVPKPSLTGDFFLKETNGVVIGQFGFRLEEDVSAAEQPSAPERMKSINRNARYLRGQVGIAGDAKNQASVQVVDRSSYPAVVRYLWMDFDLDGSFTHDNNTNSASAKPPYFTPSETVNLFLNMVGGRTGEDYLGLQPRIWALEQRRVYDGETDGELKLVSADPLDFGSIAIPSKVTRFGVDSAAQLKVLDSRHDSNEWSVGVQLADGGLSGSGNKLEDGTLRYIKGNTSQPISEKGTTQVWVSQTGAPGTDADGYQIKTWKNDPTGNYAQGGIVLEVGPIGLLAQNYSGTLTWSILGDTPIN